MPGSGTSNGRSLSPPQDRALAWLEQHAGEVRESGRGRTVFVAAGAGGGKSRLLRAAAGHLGDRRHRFRVATGALAAAADEGPERPGVAESAAAGLESAASAATVLDPSFALIAPIIGFSVAAKGLLEGLGPEQKVERSELVTRVIRAAAREEGEPLVCLVDDAEWLGGAWWTELQFGFAKEIAEELPLLLVLALEGDPDLPKRPAEDCHPGWRVARSLVSKGMADWTSLGPVSREEVDSWLGTVPREVAKALIDLTGGRSGEVASLWESWLGLGVVAEGEEGWSLVEPEGMTRDAVSELSRRLEALLPDRDRGGDEELAQVLSCGALEGRVFTASAVARALERDRDAVEDLLDTLVDEESPERGVLQPPRPLRVEDPARHRAETIWRYEFTSPLIWQALHRRVLDPAAVPELAARLVDVLHETYGREFALIAPALDRLSELAGRPEAAAHFRSLLRTPGRAVLDQRARLLLVLDTSSFTEWDHQDAAHVLTEASDELWYVSPSSSLTQYCEAAERHAIAAGENGSRALGLVFCSHSYLLIRLGKVEEAEERLEAVRSVVAEGDQDVLAESLRKLSDLKAMQKNDLAAARTLLEEAISIYRGIGSRGGEIACKYDLAGIFLSAGDPGPARALTEEALEFMRGEGEDGLAVAALYQLADIEHHCDNHEVARRHVEEVLEYVTATANTNDEASALRLLADIEHELGNDQRAWDLGSASLAMLREVEDRNGEAVALWTMARASYQLGERDRARRLALEAREILVLLGAHARAAEIDEGLGKVF